jgi:hypothetical protein
MQSSRRIPETQESEDDVIDSANLLHIANDDAAVSEPDAVILEHAVDLQQASHTPPSTSRVIATLAFIMLLLRFMMANVTANGRNPILNQPWGSILDWGILNPSRELGIAIYLLACTDWHDIRDRLRAEGYGNAAIGLIYGTLRVLVASIPSAVLGAFVGAATAYFAEEIKARPALQVLCAPPVSRAIAAVFSPAAFIITNKFLNCYYPVPVHQFNANPPLHPLQQTAMIAFRAYDATTNLLYVEMMLNSFDSSEWITHNSRFAFSVVPMDLFWTYGVDPFAFNRPMIHSAAPFQVRSNVEIIDEAEDHNVLLEDDEETIPAILLHSTFDDFERTRGAVWSGSHIAGGYDNAKLALWASTRVSMAIAAGYAADRVLSLAQEDKQALISIERSLLYAAVALASIGTDLALPWIVRKVKACWASFFSNIVESEMVETDPLLVSTPVTEAVNIINNNNK